MNQLYKSDKSVYYISVGITLAVVLWGLLAPTHFGNFANSLFNSLTRGFGWGYLFFMNIFVIFCLYIGISRYGSVKLGNATDTPEFSTLSWFAMLFSAGMGVGLVFYGAAEPLTYLMQPPFGADPASAQAARDAIRTSFFHWGLHPWAGYAVIAMPLGYLQYRYNTPGLISSIFIPLVGEKAVRGPFGKIVDILAIFATLAGITTSLGLGTLQLNSGLSGLWGLAKNTTVQVAIIAILALLYTGSAALGIEKGIKKVADFNLLCCAFLMIALVVLGPTLNILNTLVTGIGDYASNLVSQSFDISPYDGAYQAHLKSWTLYYWAWWIAWAPFVGSFIARISRGRTLRQFVTGVLVVPALGSFTWFAIFGGTAINMQLAQGIDIATETLADVSVGAFALFRYLPMGTILSVVMIVLITTFFVISANSGTYVLSMYSTEGDLTPPRSRMVVWGVAMAVLAVVLLTTGGLQNLQTVSLTAAPPFAIIMLFACVSLLKKLNSDNAAGKL